MKLEKLIISKTHDQCSYCENKEDNDTGIVYKFSRKKTGLNIVSTICPNCLKELNKLITNK